MRANAPAPSKPQHTSPARLLSISPAAVAGALGVLLLGGALAAPAIPEPTTVDECWQLVRLYPGNGEAYRCFWMIARRTGRWDEAEEALRQLLATSPDDPRVLATLGALLADRGQVECLEYLEQAADGFRGRGQLGGECFALIGLVDALRERGRFDEAQEFLVRARAVADESGQQTLISQVGLSQAWLHAIKEEYDDALTVLESVKAAVFPDGPYNLKYSTLDALAYVAWSTARYDRAVELYKEELQLAKAQHDEYQAASAAYNVTIAATRLCFAEEVCEPVEEFSDDVLRAAVASGNAPLEAKVRLWLGQPCDGDPDRRQQVVEALRVARRAKAGYEEMAALRILAQHDAAQGPAHWETARSLARQAVELAESSDSHDAVIRGYMVLGRVCFDTQQPDAAGQAWRRAMDEIELLTQQQETLETAARLTSRWGYVFYGLSNDELREATGAPDDPAVEEALAIMEQLRGHARNELFVNAGAGGARLPSSAQPLTLARIRQALAPDEALVSYQLSVENDESWIVVISHEGLATLRLPDRQVINPAIELTLGLLSQEETLADQALAELADLIITPVLDELGPTVRRLVIIPDGQLYSVPFAALRPRNEQYLVASHVVETAPSILSWLGWREQPAVPAVPAVLGVADPTSQADSGEVLREQVAASSPTALDYPALPFARKEVERVCALMGNGSTALLQARATTSSLREAMHQSQPILHFATHTVVDGDNPANSAVLLAPAGEGDDGRLGIPAILELDHGASLVVINSCWSAAGVILQGSGVLGLTQSFLSSGARAVVGNLWSVDDRSAQRLVVEMYRELAGGAAVAEALANAQRRMIAEGAPPLVWASLTVEGDGSLRFVPVASSPVSRWGIVVVAVLAVVLGVGVMIRSRRRRTSRRKLERNRD